MGPNFCHQDPSRSLQGRSIEPEGISGGSITASSASRHPPAETEAKAKPGPVFSVGPWASGKEQALGARSGAGALFQGSDRR